MDDNEKLMTEVRGIVEKQRKLAETVGTESAAYKNYMEKADETMAKFDKKNEELVQGIETSRKEAEELKDRIKTLELLGTTASGASTVDLRKDSNDVLNALLKNQWGGFISDPANMQKSERVFSQLSKSGYDDSEIAKFKGVLDEYSVKASPDLLRSDIGELGGFLCPPEYVSDVNKTITEFSTIRNYVRVKTTNSKTYREPIRVGIPKATWPGEAESGNESASKYGLAEWSPVRLTNTVGVTYDELMFNAYNLANELMMDNGEAFAVAEGQSFFNGSGVEMPLGWSVDKNVPEFTTATTSLTFDDMIAVTGKLKRGYDPMYSFNRATLAYLRTLKDSQGRYLWNPAFGDAASGSPATINGYRYSSEFIEYDNVTVAGGYPVLFADMLRFYQMVDRADVTIIRDEYTQKKKGIVEYTMNKYTFGKPKIHEAGVRVKRKA